MIFLQTIEGRITNKTNLNKIKVVTKIKNMEFFKIMQDSLDKMIVMNKIGKTQKMKNVKMILISSQEKIRCQIIKEKIQMCGVHPESNNHNNNRK